MELDNIFPEGVTLEAINSMNDGCMLEHVGIEFTEVGHNYLKAKMPVDKRTKQPMGLLHGGASVVLAESLGSIAAILTIDMTKQSAVGLEINANHIRSAKSGFVYGCVKPIHVGRTTQVWGIEITNEEGKTVCISRITIAILDKKN